MGSRRDRVLGAMTPGEPMTVAEVMEATGLTRTAAYSALAYLAQDGTVDVVDVSTDGRRRTAYVLRETPRPMEVVEQEPRLLAEDRVYGALGGGSMTVSDAAREAGVSYTSALYAVRALRARGMVARAGSTGGRSPATLWRRRRWGPRWTPCSPSSARGARRQHRR